MSDTDLLKKFVVRFVPEVIADNPSTDYTGLGTLKVGDRIFDESDNVWTVKEVYPSDVELSCDGEDDVTLPRDWDLPATVMDWLKATPISSQETVQPVDETKIRVETYKEVVELVNTIYWDNRSSATGNTAELFIVEFLNALAVKIANTALGITEE